jgi:transcriptional regulator with XRE-family HTH domain
MIDKDKLKSDIALRIKDLREKKFGKKYGSKKKFADAIGVSDSYVSDLESGRKLIGIEKANDLAEYFNVDPMWILYGRGEASGGLTEAQKLVINDAHNEIRSCVDQIDSMNKRIAELCDRIEAAKRDLQRAADDPRFADHAVEAMARAYDERHFGDQSETAS